MKVVNDLSRKGCLDTVRGSRAGSRPRHLPRDVNIDQVVREIAEKLEVLGCVGSGTIIVGSSASACRAALHDTTRAFLILLDGYTLADLIKHRGRCRRCCRSISAQCAPNNKGFSTSPTPRPKSDLLVRCSNPNRSRPFLGSATGNPLVVKSEQIKLSAWPSCG